MSSRALRRLQKQQQEQKAIESPLEDQERDESEEEVIAPSKVSAFALLCGGDDDDDEDEDENEDGTPVEPHSESVSASVNPDRIQSRSKTSRKKKKKKKSGAATVTAGLNEPDEDDIDAALAELAKSKSSTTKSADQPSAEDISYEKALENICRLLAVNSQNLHVINEMRRLFGRDVIEERPQQQQPRAAGRRGQRVQQEGRGFPEVSLKRNIFIQGKPDWPRATTGGLGMEVLGRDAKTGVTEYRFVHSTAYQDTQRQYEIAVASMDPQRLVLLLQQNPYHVATLLQVSEIMKHDRMHTEAGDILERALFAFGRTVHSTFSRALEAGKARLDFARPENREFFLACWRYILNLSMRSTWRTVYEWAKMLYSLAPEDPYQLSLVLDQYALRANQPDHFLSLVDTEIFYDHESTVWSLAYSIALCHILLSRTEEAQATLRDAMLQDRHTAHALCRKLELDPMPAGLWAYAEPTNPRAALFTNMYIVRASDLWNNPDAKQLLVSVANELPKDELGEPNIYPSEISIEIARHVWLTENDAFRRLLAQCEVVDSADVGDKPGQDPFPPHDQIISYDPRPGGGTRQPSREEMIAGFMGGGNPFGDGIEGLGRLPEEQMRMLMDEIGRLQMAGGMPEEPGDADADSEDE